MDTQNHVIKKQVVDLQFKTISKVSLVQLEVGKVYRTLVIPIIEEQMEQFGNPKLTYRIDRLELELGDLEVERLESDFPHKVEQALQFQLNNYLEKNNALQSELNEKDALAEQFELFVHFLKTGSLPWWAGKNKKYNPDRVLRDLLLKNPKNVIEAVRNLITEDKILKRLVFQFPQETLVSLTSTILKQPKQVVFDLIKEILIVIGSLESLRGYPQNTINLAVWQAALEYALFSHTRHLNWQERATEKIAFRITRVSGKEFSHFYREALEKVVRLERKGIKFNSPLPGLLSFRMEKTFKKQGATFEIGNFRSSLIDLLTTIAEKVSALLKINLKHILGHSLIDTLLNKLLVTDNLPDLISISREALLAIHQAVGLNPKPSKMILTREIVDEIFSAAKTLENQSPVKNNKELVNRLKKLLVAKNRVSKEHVEELFGFLYYSENLSSEKLLSSLLNQIVDLLSDKTGTSRKLIDGIIRDVDFLFDLPIEKLSVNRVKQLKDLILAKTKSNLQPKEISTDKTNADDYKRGQDFTESDETYLDNGGLVILWPFLSRFFQKIGLVTDNVFASPDSQYRGVFILQHLATGERDFSEAALPLNKLLCGFNLSDPVVGNIELTKQEISESQKLIEAVIVHWAALGNTSLDGIRRAFFQREGVLKVQDNNWLLQVEKQGHDILLNRLPWSLNVISLPWMSKTLLVEW